jgi:polynucleotide 5'-hydroxyl-kinase GRC3/NOL9
MLSAVAARKAAAAQSARQAQPNLDAHDAQKGQTASPPPSSPSRTPPPLPPSKTPSKRKSSGQASRKTKKKVKVRHVEDRPRYFAQGDGASERDEGVIAITSDQDEDEDELRLSPLPKSFNSGPLRSTKRPWSPSVPMRDSSDDDSMGSGDELNIPYIPPVQPRPTTTQEQPCLSTFRPLLDQNTFHLTADEINDLHLSDNCRESASVLVLAPTDTLALLGTYTLTVIHGLLSLCGVTVAPSTKPHSVFAPRSAPIPVLRCVPFDGEESSMVSHLPTRIRNLVHQDSTIIVLQELRTGIEGLGNICQTFEGVFAPSRWQKNETDQQL